MLLALIRALILFAVVVIIMRIMGKREIGKLQPFELVITLIIADLVAIPMSNTGVPLLNGLVPLFGLLVSHIVLTYASLKSIKFRNILCGTPSILIEKGKIQEKELNRLRYNINDLLEQLRTKNIPNVADVEFAILETSGELSVIPKSQKRALMPVDIKIPTKYEGIPLNLIIDGVVISYNLKKLNLDKEWLRNILSKFGIKNIKQVLFASMDNNGNIFYQLKNNS